MAAVDNLKKAVGDISTRVDAVVAIIPDLEKQVEDLKNAIAANPDTNADVQAAADQLQALVGKLNSVSVKNDGSAPAGGGAS